MLRMRYLVWLLSSTFSAPSSNSSSPYSCLVSSSMMRQIVLGGRASGMDVDSVPMLCRNLLESLSWRSSNFHSGAVTFFSDTSSFSCSRPRSSFHTLTASMQLFFVSDYLPSHSIYANFFASSLASPIKADSPTAFPNENQKAAQTNYHQVWDCIHTHICRLCRIDCIAWVLAYDIIPCTIAHNCPPSRRIPRGHSYELQHLSINIMEWTARTFFHVLYTRFDLIWTFRPISYHALALERAHCFLWHALDYSS